MAYNCRHCNFTWNAWEGNFKNVLIHEKTHKKTSRKQDSTRNSVNAVRMEAVQLAYRTVTQETCPHDSKLKMAGFKDMYECVRCQKFFRRSSLFGEKGEDVQMIETIEVTLHLLEYGTYNSLVNLRQRLRKRRFEPTFDSEILETYK